MRRPLLLVPLLAVLAAGTLSPAPSWASPAPPSARELTATPSPAPPCTGVTMDGPARARAGDTVHLVGEAAPAARVEVLFRRYGEQQFTVRRVLTADVDGGFRTTWTAADDHRWYARTSPTCSSTPGLTKAFPFVQGPAVVPRGSTVTLTVTAIPGVRTYVFFRGAGEPFSARRVLTGPGTVTYTATRDQRYYALTRHNISNHGLTQVR